MGTQNVLKFQEKYTLRLWNNLGNVVLQNSISKNVPGLKTKSVFSAKKEKVEQGSVKVTLNNLKTNLSNTLMDKVIIGNHSG